MQLLWFLPSLAYGIMLAVTTGNSFLAISTIFTMLIALLVRYRLSRRPKISTATKLRVVDKDIWLDDYRLPRGEFFWTNEQADFVFDRLGSVSPETSTLQLFLTKTFQRDAAALTVAFGFNDDGVVQRSLVEDGPHAILIGSTGSGKTELLRAMLRDLLAATSKPTLVCIDFKGGAGLDEFRTASKFFASDHDVTAAQALIDWLEAELNRRELEAGSEPALVIAIDELGHLLGKLQTCSAVLGAIAARGRSAGMHLVMTNQNLVGVNRALLSNVKLRLLIGNPDPVDAAMLGQLARTNPAQQAQQAQQAQRGIAFAQIVAHGSAAEPFGFVLPGFVAVAREQSSAQPPPARELQPLRRSTKHHREYSSQERGRHRQRRQFSIRDLLSRAHTAGSH
jgi:energy-coupling factor transporter ATP-binding protein EcfA2